MTSLNGRRVQPACHSPGWVGITGARRLLHGGALGQHDSAQVRAKGTLEPMANNSCRSAERKARSAILNVMDAENCSDASRSRALARILALINGCILEIDSRRPAPPKTDPPPFEEIYM